MKTIFWRFAPFWIFLIFFKTAAGLHYSLISPLGEQILPLWIVGLLMGGSSIIQLILDVPAGHIMDRWGYLRFLKITTFIFFFAGLCIVSGLNTFTYVASLIVATFGWLFFGPGGNAYILSHAPRENAGKFISLKDVFNSVGIVISSAALVFMIPLSPDYIGYILSALFLVALAVLFFSPKDHQSVHNTEKKISTHHHYIRRHFFLTTFKAIKRLNPASGTLLFLGLSGAIFYGTIWFVVPLVIAEQATAGILSIGLGIFDLSVVVLGFVLGSLADKVNKRLLVFSGLLLFSISGMLISFNLSWLFLIFGFLATTGDEMAGLSLWSWLHSLDKDHDHDGMISGVINLFQDFGWAIGPILAGFTYTAFGSTWPILIGAVPIFVTWIFYQTLMHRHKEHVLTPGLIPAKPHKARHRT